MKALKNKIVVEADKIKEEHMRSWHPRLQRQFYLSEALLCVCEK